MSESDAEIHTRIDQLVAREHELREHIGAVGSEEAQEHRRELRSLEESLDVAWDLLRQRDARREAGQDPAATAERPVGEVEGYQQ